MVLIDFNPKIYYTGVSRNICRPHPSPDGYGSAVGQCFKTPNDGKKHFLQKAKFYIWKSGAPTGDLKVVLYNMMGIYGLSGKPSGAPLAVSSSLSSTLISTAAQLVSFAFPPAQQYEMLPNTPYCLALQGVNPLIDLSNRISVAVDADRHHPGNSFVYGAGQWVVEGLPQAYDTIFYVYDTEPSWGDWFESIWEALVNKVAQLEDFGIDNVFYGEKFPPAVFPSAYVCPGVVESSPKTLRENLWQPTFDIGVCVQNADAKEGMMQAWTLVGFIIDALDVDKTLGGILHNLECTTVTPYWRGLGHGVEVHWVGLTIRCDRKM